MVKISLTTAGMPPAWARLCEADDHSVLIQVSESLAARTQVIVSKGKRSSVGEVVQSEAGEGNFMVTIRVFKSATWLLDLPLENDFDPGATSVENFLSVEQLSLLLAETGRNTHNAR